MSRLLSSEDKMYISQLATHEDLTSLYNYVEKLIARRLSENYALDAAGFDPKKLDNIVDLTASEFRRGAAAAWLGAKEHLETKALFFKNWSL